MAGGAAKQKEVLETQVSLTGVEQVQRGQRLIGAGFAGLKGQVGAVDKAYQSLNVSTGNLMVAGGMMVATGGGILRFLRQQADVAGRVAGTQRRLRVALSASGKGGAEAAEGIVAYNEELAKTTGAEKAALNNAAAMLATFKMGPEKIKEYLPRILDMQEGLKKVNGETMSLEQIAIMLGKGDQGMITSLRRVGIMVDQNAYKTKGYKAIIEELDKEFGGQAAEAAKGFSGQMKLASIAMDEAGESIGKTVLPAMKLGAKGIKATAEVVEWLSDHTGGAVGIVLGLAGAVLTVGGTIVVVRPAVRALAESWDWVRNSALGAAAAQKAAAAAGASAGQAAAANTASAGASTAARAAGWGGSVKGGLIGTAAAILGGMAMDWGQGGLSGLKGGKKATSAEAARMSAGTVGGAALAGGGTGAMIGSVIPGVGTAIGAAIGTAVGAGYGAFKGNRDIQAAREEGKGKGDGGPMTPADKGNAYLAEIVKLLDKQNRVIIGGGKLAAGSLNRGDIDRAVLGALARQVI